MFEPVGNRVLIRPRGLEKKTESGLVIAYGEREKLHEIADEYGTVVAIGPLAWADWGDGSHWVSVGDEVVFAKYSGKMLVDEDTEERFFIMNDEDIQAKVV